MERESEGNEQKVKKASILSKLGEEKGEMSTCVGERTRERKRVRGREWERVNFTQCVWEIFCWPFFALRRMFISGRWKRYYDDNSLAGAPAQTFVTIEAIREKRLQQEPGLQKNSLENGKRARTSDGFFFCSSVGQRHKTTETSTCARARE